MTTHKRFSIGKFLFLVAAQFMLLLLGMHMLFPKLWAVQIDFGFVYCLLLVPIFVCMLVINTFFEWGFHIFVLHYTIFPWFKHLNKQHTLHHTLTTIKLTQGRIILNEYPIDKEEKYEASSFPWYALAGFLAFFSFLLIPVQLFLLPNSPVLLGGYAAVTFSMILYEVFHAMEHFPYEWWEHAVQHSRLRRFWKKVYGFHHFHHFNIFTNEAISGFFGLPLADWAFGTYHMPKELLLSGRVATIAETEVKPPRRFVVWLMNWARTRQSKLRRLNKI